MNLASRLCGKAGPGEVLVASDSTFSEMNDPGVEFRSLMVDADGFDEQQAAFSFRAT